MPIQPMEFMRYDKISDDVIILGQNAVLKFNVSLSKINAGKRYHFYKEFEYGSKIPEIPKLLTIKRSYDYYLSIENIQKDRLTDSKAFIRIGPTDLYKLRSQMDIVYEWFTNKKYKGLFSTTRGKLILTNPVPETTLGGYPMNKFIRFIPTIIDKGEGKDRMEPGVEMDLSSYDNYVTMNVERFMGFYYTICNFNMYLAAQNMVGYIGFPSGSNRLDMGNGSFGKTINADEFTGGTEGVNDRVIDSKKNISALE